jgi:hypothetical protein
VSAHILLHHRLYAGAVGYVMWGSVVNGDVAIKFATGYDREALVLEASAYEALGRTSDRPSIPLFYGLFEGLVWDALVMSLEGGMVEEFTALSRHSR